MKTARASIILILLFWTHSACLAQGKKDILNVLFVGNSYTFVSNIPQIVSLISDSTDTKLITSKSTAPGARLSDHWRGKKGLLTKEIISNGNYDIVVLQEQSMGPIEHPDSFFYYSKKLCDYIKASKAKPYFYATWARQKAPQYQEVINKAYEEAASSNDAGIVKVGDAWALARVLRPDIELYMSDGSHQSSLGALLTACVFVGSLSEELPEKIPNWFSIPDSEEETILLIWEEPMDVTFCLRIASEICTEKELSK